MITYFERLKEERERIGLNQTAFAAVGGVSRMAQINYEKGVRYPDLAYLEAIAKIGCDIQYIVVGNRSSTALTDDELVLLEKFRNADLQLKVAAIAVLDSKVEPDQENTKRPKVVGKNVQYTEKGDITSGFTFNITDKDPKISLYANTEDGNIYLSEDLKPCSLCSEKFQVLPNEHSYCRECLNKLRANKYQEEYQKSITKLKLLMSGGILAILISWFVLIAPIVVEFEWWVLISSILLSICFVVIALYHPARLFTHHYRQCVISVKNKVEKAYPTRWYDSI